MFGMENMDLDAARLAITATNVAQIYHAYASTIVLGALAGVILGVLLFSKHSTIAIATPFDGFGKAVLKFGRKLPLVKFVSNYRRNRAMRKERELAEKAIDQELKCTLVEKIEAMVDEGRMTRKQANSRYAKYAKYHPELRYAIDKFEDNPKERILMEQADRERDVEGNVIPMPLPTAKEVLEQKKERKSTRISTR